MKSRFKLKNKRYSEQLLKLNETNKTIEDENKLYFTSDFVLLLARATGLRSKKTRHIIKRFRLVIREAILNGMNQYNTIDK